MDAPLNFKLSAPALKHIPPANGQAARLTLDIEAARWARRTLLVNSSPFGTVPR